MLNGDKQTVKHEVREQLKKQLLDSLVQLRPRVFAGLHYATNRQLLPPSIASFEPERERTILRGVLSGATWTALRAYQRGLRTSSACPFCNASPEDEEHILWHWVAWDHVHDPLLALVHTALSQVPELPPSGQWPACLRQCALAPEISTEAIKSGAAFSFLRAVHSMYVCIIAARKKRDAHSPSIFAGYRLSQQVRQYPYQQLVGPLPQTVAHGALTLRTPKGHEWKWEKSFLADLLGWLRALTWPEEPRTVTVLQLAIDFEDLGAKDPPTCASGKVCRTYPVPPRTRQGNAFGNVQRSATGHLRPAAPSRHGDPLWLASAAGGTGDLRFK